MPRLKALTVPHTFIQLFWRHLSMGRQKKLTGENTKQDTEILYGIAQKNLLNCGRVTVRGRQTDSSFYQHPAFILQHDTRKVTAQPMRLILTWHFLLQNIYPENGKPIKHPRNQSTQKPEQSQLSSFLKSI